MFRSSRHLLRIHTAPPLQASAHTSTISARVVSGLGQGRSMATEFQVTFDSADPGAHAAFWAEALHYVQQPPPRGFDSWDAALDSWGVPADQRNDRAALVDPDGAGPRLFFQKVPEPK